MPTWVTPLLTSSSLSGGISARYSHAAAYDGGKMWVFGGYDGGSFNLSSLTVWAVLLRFVYFVGSILEDAGSDKWVPSLCHFCMSVVVTHYHQGLGWSIHQCDA